YQDRRAYVWDNRSDTATLRNDHDRFVDDASWGRHHYQNRR
ncbi:lamin tail domain-containing protein, partial [Streptomyces sp. NPDC058321]